jgi:TRAP-type mannitol/chloroaromatic compound transport system permease large subunit
MNAGYILGLMSFLFLFFGYLGVPVPFALMAGVLISASFTEVSHVAIIQKMFDGMDSEALLAIPFFLLVGELMSSRWSGIFAAVCRKSSRCSACFFPKCQAPLPLMSRSSVARLAAQ